LKPLRICYIVKLRSGGLWGGDKRGLGPTTKISECIHVTGVKTFCIPPTYVKGLIRTMLEEIWDHLKRVKIVSDGLVEELLGPLTPFGGQVSSIPCNTIIGPLYPIKTVEDAKKLSEMSPLEYISQGYSLHTPDTYEEPHIRIDDTSGRAAQGALFTEVRVQPSTLFYGEIIHYSSNKEKMLEGARALLISIALMRYRYIGRRVSADIKFVCLEPEDLLHDNIISQVYSRLGV